MPYMHCIPKDDRVKLIDDGSVVEGFTSVLPHWVLASLLLIRLDWFRIINWPWTYKTTSLWSVSVPTSHKYSWANTNCKFNYSWANTNCKFNFSLLSMRRLVIDITELRPTVFDWTFFSLKFLNVLTDSFHTNHFQVVNVQLSLFILQKQRLWPHGCDPWQVLFL